MSTVNKNRIQEKSILSSLIIKGSLGLKLVLTQFKNGNNKLVEYVAIISNQLKYDYSDKKSFFNLLYALHRNNDAEQLNNVFNFLINVGIIEYKNDTDNYFKNRVITDKEKNNENKNIELEISYKSGNNWIKFEQNFSNKKHFINWNNKNNMKNFTSNNMTQSYEELKNYIKNGVLKINEIEIISEVDTNSFNVGDNDNTSIDNANTFNVNGVNQDTIPTVNNLELKQNYMDLTPKQKTTVLTELGFLRYPKKLENQLRVQAVMDTIKTTKTATGKPTNSGL